MTVLVAVVFLDDLRRNLIALGFIKVIDGHILVVLLADIVALVRRRCTEKIFDFVFGLQPFRAEEADLHIGRPAIPSHGGTADVAVPGMELIHVVADDDGVELFR